MKNTKSRVIDHTVKNHHCNLLHFTLAPPGLTPETQVGHFFIFFACSSSFGTRRQIKQQRFPSPVSGMFRRSHPSAARPEQAGPPRAPAPRPRPSGRGEATPRPSRWVDGGRWISRAHGGALARNQSAIAALALLRVYEARTQPASGSVM